MSKKRFELKSLSERELVKEALKWSNATLQEQVSMYTSNPKYRPIYKQMAVDSAEDILFLLQHLESSLALELFRSNRGILASCNPNHAPALVRVISGLNNKQDALEVFLVLNDASRRETVLLLGAQSRSRVDKALTKCMINTINKKQKTSTRIRLVSTIGLLRYLEERFHTCASVKCRKNNSIPFEPFTTFRMDPVKERCFHLACLGNEDKAMPLSELPVELLLLIGSYLPSQYRAWLCLQETYLYSVFASQFHDDEAIVSEVLQLATEVDMMRSELVHGPNVNCADSAGRTPLLLAAQLGDAAMMKLLMEKGANVNKRDSNGQTALMRSVEYGFEAGVVILLGAKDIDIDVEDVHGRTALQLAEARKSEEIVRLLRAAAEVQNSRKQGFS